MKNYTDPDKAMGTIANADAQMPIRDLFAVGCFLILNGEKVAGRKACLTALNALPLTPDAHAAILKDATERPRDNFSRFLPHNEILNLFKSKP